MLCGKIYAFMLFALFCNPGRSESQNYFALVMEYGICLSVRNRLLSAYRRTVSSRHNRLHQSVRKTNGNTCEGFVNRGHSSLLAHQQASTATLSSASTCTPMRPKEEILINFQHFPLYRFAKAGTIFTVTSISEPISYCQPHNYCP